MTSGAAATVDLDEQARSLAAKAKLVANRATEDELAWLIWSAGTLRGSIKFMAAGNWLGVKQAQKLLLQAGWAGVLARVGGRLNIPLKSKTCGHSTRTVCARARGGCWLRCVARSLKAKPPHRLTRRIISPCQNCGPAPEQSLTARRRPARLIGPQGKTHPCPAP